MISLLFFFLKERLLKKKKVMTSTCEVTMHLQHLKYPFYPCFHTGGIGVGEEVSAGPFANTDVTEAAR